MVVHLKNRGTANHVRLCAEPDRQSARVGLVYEGAVITYTLPPVTGAALGELGDQWVLVTTDNGWVGYIHREYLLLPGDPPLEETAE